MSQEYRSSFVATEANGETGAPENMRIKWPSLYVDWLCPGSILNSSSISPRDHGLNGYFRTVTATQDPHSFKVPLC